MDPNPDWGCGCAGGCSAPTKFSTLYVVGPRQDLVLETTMEPDGTFEAFLPLLVSVWDQEALPPRIGGYLVKAQQRSR